VARGFLVEYPDPDRHGQQRVNGGAGNEGSSECADVDVDVAAKRFDNGFVELGVQLVVVDELYR